MPLSQIVVVEDDPAIASAVAARLRAEGFAVEVAHTGPDGVEACRRTAPALVVLDVMLPGFDGIEACRRIQADRPVPVVMLTARDGETDVLVGLGVGADDYVTKPFSPRELVARVQAVLRRAQRAEAAPEATASTAPVLVAGLEIDRAGRRVRRGDELVHLTPTEFDLLHHLAGRPGVAFTREQLLAAVWAWRAGGTTRTVDSHVAALRRKLGGAVVRTVHGHGYALGEEPA